jgi:hypothetical protein
VRTTRALVVAGLLVSGAATLAACGSSPAPATVASCTATQLTASLSHRPEAGLGHEGMVVVLRRVGSSTCTLRGYAAVNLVRTDAAGAPEVLAARATLSGYLGGLSPGSTTTPLVTLKSGGTASFLVEGTDVPFATGASCPTYRVLRITTPVVTSLAGQLPGCSRPEVHPIVAGSTGSQSG